MLKTLRITSLIALVLAVCGVIVIGFWGLKGNPEIKAYLDKPGIADVSPDNTGKDDNASSSPLVTQAHLFALRINPPPPPKPPTPPKTDKTKKPAPTPIAARTKPKPATPPPPGPKVTPKAKFTLMATVQCQANPSRSMVLLRQTGNKDEWFWQGEKIGHLDIDEVRNGSAVFSQGGRNPQEYFVPAKPETKSLLKTDTGKLAPQPSGPGTIDVKLQPASGSANVAAGADVATGKKTAKPGAGKTAIPSRKSPGQIRQDVSSRVRRVRSVPKPPTPKEQKASINKSISSIEEIMNRQDAGVGEEQRKKENEAWMKLLNALQADKERLPDETAEEKQQDTEPKSEDEKKADTKDKDPNAK